MSYFILRHNKLNYAGKSFPALPNLERIMDRNDSRFDEFLNLGNRTIRNQNPIVKFLQTFSVNVEWDKDYLISEIDGRYKELSSLVNFTSLYNRGSNHIDSIYPEVNHNTLLVVPFGKPSDAQINEYFSISLNELVPLYPIYTNDTKQRWNIMELIDTQTVRSPADLFTIVQIDVYALIIGLYRWMKRGVDWGNSPHGYLANFPLGNCYKYHNELVNFNYLNGNGEKIEISKGGWNLESYQGLLKEYTDYKNRYLLSEPMKSFTQFYQTNKKSNPNIDLSKMVFPDTYKSLYFVQMSWVWTMASLKMVKPYLIYNNIMGTLDGLIKSELNTYYSKVQLQSQTNQIKSEVWNRHFISIWEETFAIKP